MSKRPNNSKSFNRGSKHSKYGNATNFNPSTKYLMPGHLGWLVSHDLNKERMALLNTFQILNKFNPKPSQDYLDMLAKSSNPEKEDEDEASKSDDEDLSTSLAAEIAALKGGNKAGEKSKAVKQFNKIDSGAKSMFFVKCEHLNATEILKISENMFLCEDEMNVRGMSRIFPVVASCKVSDEIDSDLVFDTIKDLLKSFLKEESEIIPKHCIRKEIGGEYDSANKDSQNFKLCLEIKVRNNSKISRRDLLKSVLAAVQSLAPGIDFDYNDTTNLFKVDLMKTVCCFSLMKNYEKFKKYNMMEHKFAVKKLKDAENGEVEIEKVDIEKQNWGSASVFQTLTTEGDTTVKNDNKESAEQCE